jgi:hypothetical protein
MGCCLGSARIMRTHTSRQRLACRHERSKMNALPLTPRHSPPSSSATKSRQPRIYCRTDFETMLQQQQQNGVAAKAEESHTNRNQQRTSLQHRSAGQSGKHNEEACCLPVRVSFLNSSACARARAFCLLVLAAVERGDACDCVR